MRLKVKSYFSSHREYFFIFVFLALTIYIKLFYIQSIESTYYIDPYNYIYQSYERISGTYQLPNMGRGFPFFLVLDITLYFSKILGLDLFLSIKILIIVINFFFYFFLFKLLFEVQLQQYRTVYFGIIFAIFEISLNEYGLVPYMELFSLLFALMSINLFLTYYKSRKMVYILISCVSILISSLTRYEILIIFLFPMVALLLLDLVSKRQKKLLLLIFIISLTLFIFMGQYMIEYYSSITRFSPLERIIMGLRPDIVLNTLEYMFHYTGLPFFDLIILISFVFGFGVLSKNLLSFTKKMIKKQTVEINQIILTLIFLSFIMSFIVTLVFYGYNYTIDESFILVNPKIISNRFLITNRTLMIPILFIGLNKIYSFIEHSTLNLKNSLRIQYIHSKIKQLFHLKLIINNSKKLKLKKIFQLRFFLDHRSKIKFKQFSLLNLIIMTNCFIGFFYVVITATETERTIAIDSDLLSLYKKSSDWLTNNLGDEELALVPFDYIYRLLHHEKSSNFIGYNQYWKMNNLSSNIADLTIENTTTVRNSIIESLKNNENIHYFVVDWMDPNITKVWSLNLTDFLTTNSSMIHIDEKIVEKYQYAVKIYLILR